MLPNETPNTQGVTPPAQVATAPVTPAPTPQETPAEPIEQWDAERAKATILAQRAEEKRLKAELKDYERLKAEEQKRLDAQLSETERLQKQAQELASQNAKLQADILRRDVIAETGLPAIFADRLKGETKEAMLADAQELLKILPTAEKAKAPHLNATNPNGANTKETDAQRRARLFGVQGNPFDLDTIKAQGGGVVWNK